MMRNAVSGEHLVMACGNYCFVMSHQSTTLDSAVG